MTSNAVNYFLKEDLDDELQCLGCKRKYDVAKNLPCGCSICSKCEVDVLSTANSDTIQCIICSEEYRKPENKLPINKTLQRLLAKTPRVIERSELHRSTMKAVEELKVISDKFFHNLNSPSSIVEDHFSLIVDAIDIRTECIISSLNEHRESLLNKVKNEKKECLQNIANISSFAGLNENFDAQYIKWLNDLKQAYLVDNQLNSILEQAGLMKKEFEKNLKTIESEILKKKTKFTDSDFMLKETHIGKLSNKRLTTESFIKNQKDVRKMVYCEKKEEDEMFFVQDNDEQKVEILEFKEDTIAVVYFNFYTNWFKIQIYSLESAEILKETQRALQKAFSMINSTKFKEYLVIAKTFDSGHDNSSLKIYDSNLIILKTVNTDFRIVHLSSDEDTIFIFATKGNKYFFHHFDANLNLTKTLESKEDFMKMKKALILSDRLYLHVDNCIKIYDDVQNLNLIETINLQNILEFKNVRVNFLSANQFVVFTKNDRKFKLFNFKKELISEFTLKFDIKHVTSFLITENGYLLINDGVSGVLHLIMD